MHNVAYFTFIIIHLCTAAAFIHSCIYILCSYYGKTCLFYWPKGAAGIGYYYFQTPFVSVCFATSKGAFGHKKTSLPAGLCTVFLYAM